MCHKPRLSIYIFNSFRTMEKKTESAHENYLKLILSKEKER